MEDFSKGFYADHLEVLGGQIISEKLWRGRHHALACREVLLASCCAAVCKEKADLKFQALRNLRSDKNIYLHATRRRKNFRRDLSVFFMVRIVFQI